jgi:L-fuconolactonase
MMNQEQTALLVDSHQHFWKYNPVQHSWMDERMTKLKEDYLPEDLYPLLEKNAIGACVAVQAAQDETENGFLLGLAEESEFIKGVVGWVDLRKQDVGDRLAFYQNNKLMKGFRHIIQDEADPEFMLQPSFMAGIGLLEKSGFTYDILIYPKHLEHALKLVRKFPNQRFVLDHIAKPEIGKESSFEFWSKGIKALAACDNLSCKVSGMVTEANWNSWAKKDFTPYLDLVSAAFGTERLMYGSDWPVCLLAASYDSVIDVAKTYFSTFSNSEQQAVFGGNAARFYQLEL